MSTDMVIVTFYRQSMSGLEISGAERKAKCKFSFPIELLLHQQKIKFTTAIWFSSVLFSQFSANFISQINVKYTNQKLQNL